VVLAQEPAPQTPQARFRARPDLVQVEVTVLDDGRRAVHGLTTEDFTLLARRRDALRPVTVRTTVVNEQGKDIASASSLIAVATFGGDRSGEQFISVPVTSLAAGDYLLRIEASAGEYSAGPAVRFRMR